MLRLTPSPRSLHNDLGLSILYQDTIRTYDMTGAQADRIAKSWQCDRHRAGFDFPGGRAAYLAQKSPLPMTQGAKLHVHLTMRAHDLQHAQLDLYCFFLNQAGRFIGRQKIICANGEGRACLTLSSSATHVAFALRVSGRGWIERPFITLRQINSSLKPSFPANDKGIAPLSLPERLSALIRERNYTRAKNLIHQYCTAEDREYAQLLRCYDGLRAYEQLARAYEALPPRRQEKAENMRLYLDALAHLGRTDMMIGLIEKAYYHLAPHQGYADFLTLAYPYALGLSPCLSSRLLERILASLPNFGRRHAVALTRCAHDLLSHDRRQEFHALAGALSRFELKPIDRARLHILAAQAAFVDQSYNAQLDCLNRAIETMGAAPLAIRAPGGPIRFDGLHAPACAPASVRGPAVTILMTAYNSAGTIEYALRSLLAQTYANLEIIVIDDASGDNGRDIVRALSRTDKRIQLISLKQNGGTYVAKNHGLKKARGAYITCQDADDWAHPQKIEMMVRKLEQRGDLVATAVHYVRYHPAQGFRGHGGYIRPDASSLMYRRKPVLEKIGYYDCVRAGADSEFQFRMERVFGAAVIEKIPRLLSLVLWSEKSLSGGGAFGIDDDTGIFSPARGAYRRSFTRWQEQASGLYLPFPLENRPFPVPAEALP